MKIVVITASPHRKGSSNLLAQRFIEGAQENGHEVVIFDAGHHAIKPCIACNACGMKGPCIQKDDMAPLQDILLDSDMVVFVTPLYYFGFCAQLKTVIDRFYNINSRLVAKHMKSALIVSAWDNVDWTLESVKDHYLALCRYLNFENKGYVLGGGCGNVQKTQESPHMQEAYELGKSV